MSCVLLIALMKKKKISKHKHSSWKTAHWLPRFPWCSWVCWIFRMQTPHSCGNDVCARAGNITKTTVAEGEQNPAPAFISGDNEIRTSVLASRLTRPTCSTTCHTTAARPGPAPARRDLETFHLFQDRWQCLTAPIAFCLSSLPPPPFFC